MVEYLCSEGLEEDVLGLFEQDKQPQTLSVVDVAYVSSDTSKIFVGVLIEVGVKKDDTTLKLHCLPSDGLALIKEHAQSPIKVIYVKIDTLELLPQTTTFYDVSEVKFSHENNVSSFFVKIKNSNN